MKKKIKSILPILSFHKISYTVKKALGSLPRALQIKNPGWPRMSNRGADQLFASAIRMDAPKDKLEASELKCRKCIFSHICHLKDALL